MCDFVINYMLYSVTFHKQWNTYICTCTFVMLHVGTILMFIPYNTEILHVQCMFMIVLHVAVVRPAE